MEATSLAFLMKKEMEKAVGCTVVILHPSRLAVIYASIKTTDKEELPIVDSPTNQEWEWRKLVSEYKSLKEDRTRESNRLHALFVQCGITTMKRSNLKTATNR